MKGCVFYDFETTGRSPAFDQALQFAAIHTDENFEELERINIRSRLLPYMLPDPQALEITGVNPNDTLSPDLLSAFEFAQTLQHLTEKWAPSTWIGYNSIRFDENFLRHIFYQNLQPNIYATQNHGNSRHDAMNIIYATFARHPETLIWPEDETGKKIFKLEKLAPANGFENFNAHDALADVEATKFMLALIRERNEAFFNEIMAMDNKPHVKSLLHSYKPMQVTLRFGSAPPKQYYGCLCGVQKNNRNSFGFFNLEQKDPMGIIDADQAVIDDIVKTKPSSIRMLQLNKALIFSPMEKPTPDMVRVCDLIKDNHEFKFKVAIALEKKYETSDPEEKQVEEKIFDRLQSPDQPLLEQFQDAPWEDRLKIVYAMKDARYRQLGMRLIACHAPYLLSNSQADAFVNFIKDRWTLTEGAKWETLETVKKWLKNSEAELDPETLATFKTFYSRRLNEVGLDFTNSERLLSTSETSDTFY